MWYVGLYETSGDLAREYARRGYKALCVDIQNEPGIRDGVEYVRADVLTWIPPRELIFEGVRMCAVWTPCTDKAVSGARWFKEKGLQGLGNGLLLADRGVQLAEYFGGSWFLENPVSTISTHWRKPDYIFHPWQYCGYAPEDNYTKKTCLWVGGGFIMPEPFHPEDVQPDDRIHKAPPGPERANFRSASPRGFCHALAEVNTKSVPIVPDEYSLTGTGG